MSLSVRDMSIGFAKAWTDYTFNEGKVEMQHHEDVTDIIEVNKILQAYTAQELTNKKTGTRWVARLPMSIDMQMMKDGVYKTKKSFNRWKNNPDNKIWALCRDVKLINKGKT